MDHPLVAKGLTKQFGDFTAVDGIDFVVEPGQTFGVLGPNGAGKSSTMKMVSTVSPRTGGDLRVFGLDPDRDGREIRSRLGVVPQEDILDVDLTARENLMIYQRYFGVPWKQTRTKADQLLEFMQLGDRGDSKVEPLSGGMKRRLTIARALVNDPEMILLDEPTTGLDPQARHLLWERLYRLKEQGVTLLLTTHYMDEAEQLADRLVIMDHGKIVAEGSPAELITHHTTREVVELRFDDGEHDATALAPVVAAAGLRVDELPDRYLVYADDGDALIAHLHESGVRPLGTYVRRSSLEDVFLTLTGRSLVE
ncbi:ABC transporter ATP-binding protein [Acidimicrobiales bacterium]|nr:ABC transporter ATP-binding protein [bacterium]MDB9845186.1 ABC transporter ATP-binding protein [Acidimicrobiales bacterium]